jgi:hypothetical protein
MGAAVVEGVNLAAVALEEDVLAEDGHRPRAAPKLP